MDVQAEGQPKPWDAATVSYLKSIEESSHLRTRPLFALEDEDRRNRMKAVSSRLSNMPHVGGTN